MPNALRLPGAFGITRPKPGKRRRKNPPEK
jgi:hypothetical protein